jgi:hypothetical protein
MAYVHGHATCVRADCPMKGVNQAECCDGETAAQCPVPTSEVAAVHGRHHRRDLP